MRCTEFQLPSVTSSFTRTDRLSRRAVGFDKQFSSVHVYIKSYRRSVNRIGLFCVIVRGFPEFGAWKERQR
jgi:hypothetical protein